VVGYSATITYDSTTVNTDVLGELRVYKELKNINFMEWRSY